MESRGTASPGRGRLATAGLWIATLLVAVMVAGPGLSKATTTAIWVERFEGWGLPGSWVWASALAELGGGLLLLLPRTATVGGLLIASNMAVATWAHATTPGEAERIGLTLALMALALLVAWARRSRSVVPLPGTGRRTPG